MDLNGLIPLKYAEKRNIFEKVYINSALKTGSIQIINALLKICTNTNTFCGHLIPNDWKFRISKKVKYYFITPTVFKTEEGTLLFLL
jgi:hypothetical protein